MQESAIFAVHAQRRPAVLVVYESVRNIQTHRMKTSGEIGSKAGVLALRKWAMLRTRGVRASNVMAGREARRRGLEHVKRLGRRGGGGGEGDGGKKLIKGAGMPAGLPNVPPHSFRRVPLTSRHRSLAGQGGRVSNVRFTSRKSAMTRGHGYSLV
jgi:hypothetical protein